MFHFFPHLKLPDGYNKSLVTMSWLVFEYGGDNLQIWRTDANIYNKQSQRAVKWQSCSVGWCRWKQPFPAL